MLLFCLLCSGFLTEYGLNTPAQLKRLARILKFCMSKFRKYFLICKYKCANQTASMQQADFSHVGAKVMDLVIMYRMLDNIQLLKQLKTGKYRS